MNQKLIENEIIIKYESINHVQNNCSFFRNLREEVETLTKIPQRV